MEPISTSTVQPVNKKSLSECSTNQDCNPSNQSNPNICVNLNNFSAQATSTIAQSNVFILMIQFLAQKDPEILLKYNKISQFLKYNEEEIPSLLKQFNLNMTDLKNISVCICNSNFKGYRCQISVPGIPPSGCDSGDSIKACDAASGIHKDGQFLLNNNLQSPNGLTQQYKSSYCECTAEGILGVNCEYRSMQCQASQLNSTYFVGSLASQASICNPSNLNFF